MVAVKRNYSAPLALAASILAVFGAAGCGPAADSDSCAEATYDDVGNLTAGVIGLTIDDLGVPVPGVRVFVPGTSIDLFSDANGRFHIDAASLAGKTSLQVMAEKSGYPDKVQDLSVPADRIADLVLTMKPFSESDTFDASTGGTVSDGITSVTFLPGSLAVEGSTEPVTGDVEISIVTYRPQSPQDMAAAPGRLLGEHIVRDGNGDPVLDGQGNPTYATDEIRTFGMADVSMYQNGQRLELIPGMPARVVMNNIVEGNIDFSAIEAWWDENKDLVAEKPERTIPLWHFNYGKGYWDRVEDEDFSIENGSEAGFLTLTADVPEFSPCNPDMPPVVCTRSIDIEQPVPTCVCKNVKNANGVENVRGSSMTLLSRALEYTYLVVSCSDGTGSRTLIGTSMQTFFDRTTTDQEGNFCGQAIVDPKTRQGTVRIDSTKTYWPGRLDDEDIQYKDVEGDGSLDDNQDGKIDEENIIGFLGDTHYDVWPEVATGVRQCGPPDGELPVKCINQPVDPVNGQYPQ